MVRSACISIPLQKATKRMPIMDSVMPSMKGFHKVSTTTRTFSVKELYAFFLHIMSFSLSITRFINIGTNSLHLPRF